IDEIQAMLDDIAREIPDDFFQHLNGGVILLDECKPHPKSSGDLYIMGEYHNSRDMGRHICIYYGSFMRMYARASESVLRRKLRDTLLHEFTHHLESLAGERGLEIRDRIEMEEYLDRI
ncbi:MAG: metallopeptidase family protein, partial [Oscillospiraceae bacterium]|nr:metallopeptidase family protein [Oscillospiraceae bacterium]